MAWHLLTLNKSSWSQFMQYSVLIILTLKIGTWIKILSKWQTAPCRLVCLLLGEENFPSGRCLNLHLLNKIRTMGTAKGSKDSGICQIPWGGIKFAKDFSYLQLANRGPKCWHLAVFTFSTIAEFWDSDRCVYSLKGCHNDHECTLVKRLLNQLSTSLINCSLVLFLESFHQGQ